jgi:hypothetical protein
MEAVGMSESQQPQPKKGGWLKAITLGSLGLCGGAFGTYATAVFDKIAKPALPVANFSAAADGFTLICQNHASGDTGWWDFGDGSSLEPFNPNVGEVKHTYAKPGNYSVKLTVRNFTADENDRTVQVDVGGASASAAPGVPQISGFVVQPISPVSLAPATFRVTAEIKDADHAVWDLGDGRLEVVDGSGKLDRLVTFDKPGAYPLQLVAHNGKQAVKQAAAVRVDAPAAGTLMAVLKVIDSGNKVERGTRSESVAIQVPKDKAAPGFTKTLPVKPGFTLIEAMPANPNLPGVKNLKAEVAADKKTATVSGEWVMEKNGKPAGSDLLIPLRLTEERTTATESAPIMLSSAFSAPNGYGQMTVTMQLPPSPKGLAAAQRRISLGLLKTAPDGRQQILTAVPELKLPWSANVDGVHDGLVPVGGIRPAGGSPLNLVSARQQGDSIVLTVGW